MDTDVNQELPESDDPCMATARKGMKRKWTSEENISFMDFFRDEIRTKKMPAGSKIMQSLKILTGRTVAQIRTRVHNIIRDKQKAKKKC
ncbi:hypothetical protein DPMN_091904 [Dreissena polymorpha]|uniref:Uncharacterized protein n=1 Tax=Dreissena polymorpha TaxID=45954 RepID=A0A9D4L0P3_DREPO|nr:hypothetical protein DPMN_091904 [Dreissena polymorpha]